jgi:hypothetical protein
MIGREEKRSNILAQRYFQRAQSLDPALDSASVLPSIAPNMIGMLAPGARPPDGMGKSFEEAAGKIRRLGVEAFPELPPAVAGTLTKRGCSVPQPEPSGQAVNVIRGEFFTRGESGWAVLCSVGGQSSILVFRNGEDTAPEELAGREDKAYLQGLGGDLIGYSRQIAPVGRDYIIRHYRAYGGPEPPPIDHQAIDDAFLEKASTVRYRHLGKWLELQGAD